MISGTQRNAASLYWTQVLTGEMVPQQLTASKQGLPTFMAAMEATHRKGYLELLEKDNPSWPLRFMNALDSLLSDANESLVLKLEYHPEGLLKQAADKAGIPEGLFPTGKLSMSFDKDGHIIVGAEKINAEHFINSEAQRMTASLK